MNLRSVKFAFLQGGFPLNSVSIKVVDNRYDSFESLAIKGIYFPWELGNVTSPLLVSDWVEFVDVSLNFSSELEENPDSNPWIGQTSNVCALGVIPSGLVPGPV